jgi:hypothetical protein
VGVLYNQTITASNGTGNKTMMVSNYNAGGTGLALPSISTNTVTFNSTPTATGTVSFDVTATDTVTGTAMQHYSFSINQATPSVSVSDAGGTYTANSYPASATVTGISGLPGSTLEGVGLTLTYYSGTYLTVSNLPPSGGSSTAPSQAGSYTVLASFPGSGDYSAAQNLATFSIAQKSATVTANNKSRFYGLANPPLDATITGTVNSDVLNYTLATSASPSSPVGSYDITVTLGANPNYSITTTKGTLSVTPAPLSATGINFSATAGAPLSGLVATFNNPDPQGTPSSYTASLSWGDGSTSTGLISDSGKGIFQVSGTHTYADPKSYPVAVSIQHTLGYTTPGQASSTATVSSLGQEPQQGQTASFGFWVSQRGLALLQSFNGGPSSTALANWLAGNFANLFGTHAGSHDLSGKSNTQVAQFLLAYFTPLSLFTLDVEVLTTALNVYATTQSLGGPLGQADGFTVDANGLGAASVNVGVYGAAFGVPNTTTLNVWQLLQAANSEAVGGALWPNQLLMHFETLLVLLGLNEKQSAIH